MEQGDEFIFRMRAQTKCGLLCGTLVAKNPVLLSE